MKNAEAEQRLRDLAARPFYDPCGCGQCHGPFSPGPCPSIPEMEANLKAYKEAKAALDEEH